MTLERLDHVVATAGEHAADVDRRARFPRETVDALAESGLLGLTVPAGLGGLGGGPVEVFEAVSAVASRCASAGMVYTMHICAMAVLQSVDDGRFDDVLREAAAGRHLSTLALSEKATRSNFWVSLGKATAADDGGAFLELEKSFVTSAGPANSYVVSAATPGRAGQEDTDLFLVHAEQPGIEVLDWWQGSGLRGNSSAPMRFHCTVAAPSRIGSPATGRDTLLNVVIPWFQLGAASVSAGLARAAADATRRHLVDTLLEHLGERLIDQPVVRHGLGMMWSRADALAGFVRTVASGMAAGTAPLEHILELKATANEVALAVTDEAMRLCGGAAYAGRLSIDRFFRDARAGVVMAPTPDMLYDMVGRVVAGMPQL